MSRDFYNYRRTNRSQSGVAIVVVQAVFMFSYSYVIFMYFGESIYDISIAFLLGLENGIIRRNYAHCSQHTSKRTGIF